MGSHSLLGARDLWNLVLGWTFNSIFLSESDKQNHNPVDLEIKGIKTWSAQLRILIVRVSCHINVTCGNTYVM